MTPMNDALTALATAQAQLDVCKKAAGNLNSSMCASEKIKLHMAIRELDTKLNRIKNMAVFRAASESGKEYDLAQHCLSQLNTILEEDGGIEAALSDQFTIIKPLSELKLPPAAVLSFSFQVETEYESDDEGGYMSGLNLANPWKITWDHDVLSVLLSLYVDIDSFTETNEDETIDYDLAQKTMINTFIDAFVDTAPDWQYDHEIPLELYMDERKSATFNVAIAAIHALTDS